MTQAELRALLLDCLALWQTPGTVTVTDLDIVVRTKDTTVTVRAAEEALRPVRWFYLSAEREAAERPPRAAASVVGLLSAVRNALDGDAGQRLRIGGGQAGK